MVIVVALPHWTSVSNNVLQYCDRVRVSVAMVAVAAHGNYQLFVAGTEKHICFFVQEE